VRSRRHRDAATTEPEFYQLRGRCRVLTYTSERAAYLTLTIRGDLALA
jgi:hypothetical protein